MAAIEKTYQRLHQHFAETAKLESINSLLGWDERTLMPPAAADYRAEQMTFLSGLIHQRRTDARAGQWLVELADSDLLGDPHSAVAANIRELKRIYDRETKLPQRLVEELTGAAIHGQQSWVKARAADDYSQFAPHLERIVSLLQEKADALEVGDCRYDALLDEYEPHGRTAEITPLLAELAERSSALVKQIVETGRRPNVSVLSREFPVDAQAEFGRAAATKIGFEFDRGRIDVTHHPFCSELGPSDCRITTRYNRNFFPSAFFGTLHEAGHGIYEQGLLPEEYGLPAGHYMSLGIHESQSRMWENHVGRSRAFWEHFYPSAQATFSQAIGEVSLDEFYWTINSVQPSLIRVEADEATYNLHIVIRFELERELVEGDLAIADLPDAWNARYEKYLGVQVPNNADGVLQDIHWSSAAIGYFSTYSLGNLYASQLFDQAKLDLGDIDAMFRKGEFEPLREWLRKNVHSRGQCLTASELIQEVTGKPLTTDPLMAYLTTKLAPLYSLDMP